MNNNLTLDEINLIIAQLDQAIYNHEQWHKQLTRTLVSRGAHDPRDIAPDAHRRCLFGQWYYSGAHPKLRQFPGFEAIETEHRHMHWEAARLLNAVARQGPIPTPDYDAFSTSLDRLRLQVQTLKREMEDSLYRRDPLTGVSGRVALLTQLREQQELVKRSVHEATVVMLDLDAFKEVNDRFGHRTGDSVLAAVGHYLLEHARPYDKVFRYGGEEFLLCLPDVGVDAAVALAERLRLGIAALETPVAGQPPVRVTASVGIAPLEGHAHVEETIDAADKAMYAAKHGGRNRTCVWRGTLHAGEIVCPAP